jgi:7-cyano-7-deazaguanine synthase in queuosine biosynthesis
VLRTFRSFSKEETCHCCTSCNSKASDFWAASLSEKAAYLIGKYQNGEKSIRQQPDWSLEELDQLTGGLRGYVKALQNKKRLLMAKLENLRLVSMGSEAIPIRNTVFLKEAA